MPQRRPTSQNNAPAQLAQVRFLSDADAATLAKLHAGGGHVRHRPNARRPTPPPIAGKTGTAEVDDGRAHSWFAGFAPFGGTRAIAFAVIVENAGYGARAAAPIAGEIVNAARDLGLMK